MEKIDIFGQKKARENKEKFGNEKINGSQNHYFQAMIHLFEKGDNTWSLFIGHLVLEKLLKAWYVKVDSNTSFYP